MARRARLGLSAALLPHGTATPKPTSHPYGRRAGHLCHRTPQWEKDNGEPQYVRRQGSGYNRPAAKKRKRTADPLPLTHEGSTPSETARWFRLPCRQRSPQRKAKCIYSKSTLPLWLGLGASTGNHRCLATCRHTFRRGSSLRVETGSHLHADKRCSGKLSLSSLLERAERPLCPFGCGAVQPERTESAQRRADGRLWATLLSHLFHRIIPRSVDAQWDRPAPDVHTRCPSSGQRRYHMADLPNPNRIPKRGIRP